MGQENDASIKSSSVTDIRTVLITVMNYIVLICVERIWSLNAATKIASRSRKSATVNATAPMGLMSRDAQRIVLQTRLVFKIN